VQLKGLPLPRQNRIRDFSTQIFGITTQKNKIFARAVPCDSDSPQIGNVNHIMLLISDVAVTVVRPSFIFNVKDEAVT